MTRIHDARRLAGWLFATLLLCGCTYVPTYESTEDPAYRPSLQAGNNGLRYIDGQLFCSASAAQRRPVWRTIRSPS